jgi:uncharacterized membrane protein YdjX (TVP38/TMEM64 family)
MAASPKDRPVGNPLRAAASDDYSTLDNEDSAGSAKRRRRSRWMLALAVITACCVGSALAVIFRKDVLRACYRIGRLPPIAGGLLFSGLLALWLTCLLPTSLLEIAAGYVFGFFWATVWSTAGKVAGSVLSYWIGRCARSWVRRMILADDTSKEHGYLRGLEIAMTEEPGRTCLALRLAYVPEAIQNYVPAIFDAPFLPFLLATTGGSAVYAALWANLGASIGDVAELSATERRMTPEKTAFLCFGALGLGCVFGLIHWNTQRTLRRFADLQRQLSPPASPSASTAVTPGRPSLTPRYSSTEGSSPGRLV